MYRIPIYTVSLVREKSLPVSEKRVTESSIAASIIRTFLGDTDRECFVAMFLDCKNAVIGINLVSMGSLSLSIVHPRELFKPAILLSSAAIVIGHNHPSGETEPSPEDRALTRRIKDAGELIGIRLLDHIILGDSRHYSFADSHQF